MSWPWFGPISNNSGSYDHFFERALTRNVVAEDFNITLDEVNWLGNIVALIYLPTAFIIPYIVARYGLRRCVWNLDAHFVPQNAQWLDSTKLVLLR